MNNLFSLLQYLHIYFVSPSTGLPLLGTWHLPFFLHRDPTSCPLMLHLTPRRTLNIKLKAWWLLFDIAFSRGSRANLALPSHRGCCSLCKCPPCSFHSCSCCVHLPRAATSSQTPCCPSWGTLSVMVFIMILCPGSLYSSSLDPPEMTALLLFILGRCSHLPQNQPCTDLECTFTSPSPSKGTNSIPIWAIFPPHLSASTFATI